MSAHSAARAGPPRRGYELSSPEDAGNTASRWVIRAPRPAMLPLLARPASIVGVPLLVAGVEFAVWNGSFADAWGNRTDTWPVAILLVAVHVPLTARHRFPLAVLVAMMMPGLLTFVVPNLQPSIGLIVALYAVGRRSPPAASVAALVSCVLPWTFYAWTLTRTAVGVDTGDALVVVVLWTLVGSAVWALGYAERGRAARALDREGRLLAAVDLARAEERRALARELHDSVAGSLGGIVLQAAGARAVLGGDPVQADGALYRIEDTGVQALREMHRLLVVLRQGEDAVPGPADGPGVPDAAELLAHASSRGLDVRVTGVPLAGLGDRLDPSVGLAAYRVVQECLTNAERHGGPGTRVAVTVALRADTVVLTMASASAGRGPARHLPRSGTGLPGLRERIELVGGRLDHGWRGREFVVSTNLPLRERPTAAVPRIDAPPGSAATGDPARPGHVAEGRP